MSATVGHWSLTWATAANMRYGILRTESFLSLVFAHLKRQIPASRTVQISSIECVSRLFYSQGRRNGMAYVLPEECLGLLPQLIRARCAALSTLVIVLALSFL